MARRTRKQITEAAGQGVGVPGHTLVRRQPHLSRCGRFTYCSGRSYDRQRCRSCFIEHGTNGKPKHEAGCVMAGIHWTDRDQLLSEVARQEVNMTTTTTPTKRIISLDQYEIDVLIEGLECLLCAHMGTPRFPDLAMQVIPMLTQIRTGS